MLLDEITVDLDVVARMDLLQFLAEECEKVGGRVGARDRGGLRVLGGSSGMYSSCLCVGGEEVGKITQCCLQVFQQCLLVGGLCISECPMPCVHDDVNSNSIMVLHLA